MIDGYYDNYRELAKDCVIMGIEPEYFLNEIKRRHIVYPPDIQAKIDEIEAKTKQEQPDYGKNCETWAIAADRDETTVLIDGNWYGL